MKTSYGHPNRREVYLSAGEALLRELVYDVFSEIPLLTDVFVSQYNFAAWSHGAAPLTSQGFLEKMASQLATHTKVKKNQ